MFRRGFRIRWRGRRIGLCSLEFAEESEEGDNVEEANVESLISL